jgi:hypothetical protein
LKDSFIAVIVIQKIALIKTTKKTTGKNTVFKRAKIPYKRIYPEYTFMA